MTATSSTHQLDHPNADGSPEPESFRVLAFANQKGGVGKTTSTVNTAVVLARRGFRVLLVDSDPQGNATSSLGVEKQELAGETYDVLVDEAPVAECVSRDVRPSLDLLPTTALLAAAEVELVNADHAQYRLRNALTAALDDYDVVLIDCPPSLGLLTVNALTAADGIIVPIQCEFLALEGVSQLVTTIDRVHQQLNPSLDILGVLMTMYDSRTRLSAHVVDEVRRFFGERMFSTLIPRSIRLAEAPSYGKSIVEYDPSSRGGIAYASYVDELIARAALTPSPRAVPSPEHALT